MKIDEVPLWSAALHKEALDLMVGVWPNLPEVGREALIEQIIAGPPMPPPEEGSQQEGERRRRWRDRRIFERLTLLERLRDPPLPSAGNEALVLLRELYPEWRVEDGDRAHLSFWMESYDGLETDRRPEQLEGLSGGQLIEALRAEGQDREGRLAVWGRVVGQKPGLGIGMLRHPATTRPPVMRKSGATRCTSCGMPWAGRQWLGESSTS